ncbi:MAG: right-handed parallel beta-helix repeat-containing protein, partial [Candidatus Diapherotrites archaeon]|nr:right-handed parallel beta-helix repeat-containing protein [Candidatus Diapherotrites archaeon]
MILQKYIKSVFFAVVLLVIFAENFALTVSIERPADDYMTASYLVEFVINDTTATDWTVDMNYSTSPAEGTGTVIEQGMSFSASDKTPLTWDYNVVFGDFHFKLVVFDLDSDGDLDIVADSKKDNLDKIVWYENDGSNNFTRKDLYVPTVSSSVTIKSMDANDLDNDGDLDIVIGVTYYSSGYRHEVWVLTNRGDLNFTESTLYVGSEGIWELGIGDLDGDGNKDIVFVDGDGSGSELKWARNLGDMNFSINTISSSVYGDDEYFHKIWAVDIDGDGDLDLVGPSASEYNKSGLWINAGDGNFSYATFSLYGGFREAVGDIDNDGDLDIFTSWSGDLYLHENTGDGNFTQCSRDLSLMRGSLQLADIDSDGDLDVVFGSSGYTNNIFLYWMENNGESFTSYPLHILRREFAGGFSTLFEGVAVYDLDGDGLKEVLASRWVSSYPLVVSNPRLYAFYILKPKPRCETIAANQYRCRYKFDPSGIVSDGSYYYLIKVSNGVSSAFTSSSFEADVHSPFLHCPQDDTIIDENAVFSPLDCNVKDYVGDGIFKVKSGDVTINCNGMKLSADYTGTAIDNNEYFSPITIKNCEISNFLSAISMACWSPKYLDMNGINVQDNNFTNNISAVTIYPYSNSNVSNVNFRSNLFFGNNYILYLVRPVNLLFSDNNISHNELQNGLSLYAGEDLNIYHNILESNTGRHGIYISGSTNILIEKNADSGSEFSYSYLDIGNHNNKVFVFDNVFSSPSDWIIHGWRASDVNIIQNAFSNADYETIYLSDISSLLIKDNNLISNYNGIIVKDCTDCNISDNNVFGNRTGIGLEYSLTNVYVKDNYIANCTSAGISLYNGSYDTNRAIIQDNNILNNNYGISLYKAKKFNIIGNTIRMSSWDGIKIYSDSSDNNIIGNEISFAQGVWYYYPSGIKLYYGATNNIIEDNNIYENPYGIYIDSSSVANNIIKDNNIYENSYGIYIEESSTNLIYNNYFANTINAVDESGNAQDWNIAKQEGTNIVGKPYLGGNYWSDYAGEDN